MIWFRHIMSVAIFKIGSLQFQPFKMIYLDEETIGEPYMSFMAEQKKALPAGSPVLNCHIQQGADLRPESVNLSFKMAKAFFAEYFRKSNIKRSCVIAGCCTRPCRCISPAIQISDSSPVVFALSGIALIRRRQKSFFLLTEQERRLPQKRPPCKCWHSLTRKSLAMPAAL